MNCRRRHRLMQRLLAVRTLQRTHAEYSHARAIEARAAAAREEAAAQERCVALDVAWRASLTANRFDPEVATAWGHAALDAETRFGEAAVRSMRAEDARAATQAHLTSAVAAGEAAADLAMKARRRLAARDDERLLQDFEDRQVDAGRSP